MSSKLLVFRDHSYLFGILPEEYDMHLPLNQVTITQDKQNSDLWFFETKKDNINGQFVHPLALFGFRKYSFSQNSVLFIRNLSHSELPSFGLVMNDFYMQLSERRVEPKKIEPEVVKNFPKHFPKDAFHYVQRYKRKNIFVINPDALLAACKISLHQPVLV